MAPSGHRRNLLEISRNLESSRNLYPELPPDIKPDLPIQGHWKDCCLAADRIPPGEQIVSRSSVSLQTGSLHRDRPPEDLLRHSGCCRFGSGDSPWTAGPERGLWYCRPRHSLNKASSIVRCLRICASLDRIFHPASESISQLQWSNLRTATDAIRRAARISPGTTLVHPLHRRCDINCHFTRHWGPLVRWRQSTLPTLPLHQPIDCCNEIAECIESVERWMRSNRLKLNSDKTQFMWLGSKQQLAKIETECMQIGEHCIKFSTSAKNLGVTFDPELKMDLHVNNITRSCFFQLRQLRSIRRSLTMEATKTLVHSLVSSRVDYCNSIFYGATNAVLRRLQSVLNAAARLITNTRKFDHITPVLRDQLHWLPIRQRIIFKIATFVRNSLHGRGPIYLSRYCIPISVIGARAHLRSAARGHLATPRTRTRRFGPRSFRVSGPAVWNSLPEDIANPELSLEHFKTGLKTHLFRLAYA